MNRDEIIRMAKDAGAYTSSFHGRWIFYMDDLERFAALVAAAEREKVAAWMIAHLYATGHGDTTEDMLEELEWQIAEREREACARLCEEHPDGLNMMGGAFVTCAAAIRARSE